MTIKNAGLVSMLIKNFKKFGDLKFQKSIIWSVQLFDLMLYQIVKLKLKFCSGRIFFFNFAIWIDFVKKKWIEKSWFGEKTETFSTLKSQKYWLHNFVNGIKLLF